MKVSVLRLLQAAEGVLHAPTRWCTGVAALRGRAECDSTDPLASKRCLLGAVEYAASLFPVSAAERTRAVEEAFVRLGMALTGLVLHADEAGERVQRWHDRPGRRYGEVIELLRKAHPRALPTRRQGPRALLPP